MAAEDIDKSPSFAPLQYRKKKDDYYGGHIDRQCPDGAIKPHALKTFLIAQMIEEAERCEAKAQAERFEAMRWLHGQMAVIGREIKEFQGGAV